MFKQLIYFLFIKLWPVLQRKVRPYSSALKRWFQAIFIKPCQMLYHSISSGKINKTLQSMRHSLCCSLHCRENAQLAERVNQYARDKWHFYQDEVDQWQWDRIAPNGEIVARSPQGFSNQMNCVDNARRSGYQLADSIN